jgi:L-aspartate oxidase
MNRYHDMGELAPRDVVSRSIVAEMARTGGPVFLDVTHLGAEFVQARFPRVYQTCISHGIDITAGRVPVHPAAHYAMGGVATDLHCQTTVQGLFAAGEVACTGVHGANRLASNSLLEGVVFGARAGRAMRAYPGELRTSGDLTGPALYPDTTEAEVRAIAWERCGLSRTENGLATAYDQLQSIAVRPSGSSGREKQELRNIYTVASLIARCGLARRESRGGHYRTDYPEPTVEFQKHSVINQYDTGVRFESTTVAEIGTLD